MKQDVSKTTKQQVQPTAKPKVPGRVKRTPYDDGHQFIFFPEFNLEKQWPWILKKAKLNKDDPGYENKLRYWIRYAFTLYLLSSKRYPESVNECAAILGVPQPRLVEWRKSPKYYRMVNTILAQRCLSVEALSTYWSVKMGLMKQGNPGAIEWYENNILKKIEGSDRKMEDPNLKTALEIVGEVDGSQQ